MISPDLGAFGSMTTSRIHVFGAAGTGVTTLAQALADHLGHRYLDADDYLWVPTKPPYQTTAIACR